MLKLYYNPGSCSLASHIVLEEVGADFETVRLNFAADEQKGTAYRAINPKGKVPALVTGDWVLTETPAILGYLARLHPEAGLIPDDAREAARCAEWLAWLSSTIHPAYRHVMRPERFASAEAIASVVDVGQATCRELWSDVDRQIGQGPWALGERYSVADSYLFVIWTWGRKVLDFNVTTFCPNWTAHARRMRQRPAVQAAMEREGLSFPE